jgi:hypothetical protein
MRAELRDAIFALGPHVRYVAFVERDADPGVVAERVAALVASDA